MRPAFILLMCCFGLLACQPEETGGDHKEPPVHVSETPLAKVEPQRFSEPEAKADIAHIVQDASSYRNTKRKVTLGDVVSEYQAFYQGDELILLRVTHNAFDDGQTKVVYLLKAGRLAYYAETGQMMQKNVDKFVLWEGAEVKQAQDRSQPDVKTLSEEDVSQISAGLEMALTTLNNPDPEGDASKP